MRRRAGTCAAVLAVCEHWEIGGAAIGTSPTAAGCACFDGERAASATCRCARSSTTARCTTSRPPSPPRRSTRRRRRRWPPSARRARRCWRCWPARTSPRAGRCSSSTTRSCSRARCAAPSRPTRRCWRSPGRRARSAVAHRLQRPARGRRPLPRHDRGGARVRRQPRLRRRRAARPDQLPELRQPREAARRLAADRVGARSRRRLPRAGGPVVGGNVSLYNEGAAGPIYPTPVVGMVGRLPDARAPGGSASRATATRSRSSDPSRPCWPPASWPGCAASRLPDGLPAFDIAAVRAAQLAVRDAVRAGALASAHDIAEGGLAIALAECCLAGGLGARIVAATRPRFKPRADAPLRRGARGLSRERHASALGARRAPSAVDRDVGGQSLRSPRGAEILELTLAELGEAHGALRRCSSDARCPGRGAARSGLPRRDRGPASVGS